MYKNTKDAYGSISKWFHWLIALLVVIMLVVGYFMDDWGIGAVFNLHKLIGLLILLLVLGRVVWVLSNERPNLPVGIHKWERIAARSVQGLLYLCLIVMPLSGWAMSTASGYFPHIGSWVIPMPGIPLDQNLAGMIFEVHETTAVILIALICAHALGAIKHHFFDKDDVLIKMLPASFVRKKV